jgi:hypothetical protein
MTPLDFSTIDQTIPRRLPVLDRYVSSQHGRQPLEGVTALLIQHQLGNHFPQAAALLALGLKREQVIWVDVPYTACPQVREAVIEELRLDPGCFRVHDFQVLDRYPPYQMARIQRVMHDLLRDPPERLVVLDDGAYFIEAAACFVRQLPSVAVVEQTTRGLIKIEESPALSRYARRLPIVNVARSKPKSTLEPPFIGRAVCDSLSRYLDQLPHGGDLRCLVLGFGAIGARVAEYLPERLCCERGQVHVFDPDHARQQLAQYAGFPPWDRGSPDACFKLVVGCSGRRSFTLDDRDHLANGAILASASSGTVELSRQDFIELANISPLDDISVEPVQPDRGVHCDLRIRLPDREVTFVNGGFPVNFDGRINCIPSRYIQPTPAMMVAATVQAAALLETSRTGLIDLDPEFCAWINREFRAELEDEAALLDDGVLAASSHRGSRG